MKKLTIYTDGSCLKNPGAGGWAWIIIDNDLIIKDSGGDKHTTNNIMELSACINALKSLKEPCKIDLYSDSQYVVKGINEWLSGWVKTDFKGKKNVELWKSYLEVSKIHDINAIWVKAHNGDKYNEMCDELARSRALEYENNTINANVVLEKRISKYHKIEEKLGYKFKNETLLNQALTHKSFSKTHNERLEFLGDAVLDLIVANILYKDFSRYSEGDLSKLRAALVNEKSFAKIASYLEIGEFLQLSVSEENNGGRKKPSLLSDAYEAIIGAIYLESGYEIAANVGSKILNEVFPKIDIELIKDYKTKLQEKTQAIMAQTPEYRILQTKGPDHKKEFEIGLFLNDELFTKAMGNSKKEAEQSAAKLALEKLEDE